MNSKEWGFKNQFNPFNSYKLLAHLDRWRYIRRGKRIPPPVLVTIDPSNACNHDCEWCNSKLVIKKEGCFLSKLALRRIVKALDSWSYLNKKFKVRAVCIAGGGEPLLNKNTGFLIDELVRHGFDVGVVTNGSLINEFIEPLSKCHWVSVSVDSGTAKTFSKLKGVELKRFNKIIDNIKLLTNYAQKNKTYLSRSALSFGVTYKFLLHPDNINEIEVAAKLAKSNGCKSMHIRPVGCPWYKKSSKLFNKKHIEEFHEKITSIRKLEDDSFSIYGITHKFTDNFQPKHNFLKCHALFMTAVFMPPRIGESPDSFSLGQCCDRRGDSRVELARNITNIRDVFSKWGSDPHWGMQDKLDLNKCPRCTYSPHNEIYEKILCEDNMSIDFI